MQRSRSKNWRRHLMQSRLGSALPIAVEARRMRYYIDGARHKLLFVLFYNNWCQQVAKITIATMVARKRISSTDTPASTAFITD